MHIFTLMCHLLGHFTISSCLEHEDVKALKRVIIFSRCSYVHSACFLINLAVRLKVDLKHDGSFAKVKKIVKMPLKQAQRNFMSG